MRFSRIPSALALVLPILPALAQPATRIEADFVLENVNLVPMNEEIILADKSIAVRNGVIVGIVDGDESRRLRADKRVDGDNAYLLPGLTDMHVHLRMDPRAFFNLQLANGVTTVHNMGDGDGGGEIDHVALRADVAAGRMDGPRYLISGPQLHGKQLPTPADVQAMLDRHAARGFDTIKVHGDLARDAYDALIEGAHARGFRVTGHAQHMMPLEQTLRMDAVEHMEEFLYVSRDDAFAVTAAGGKDNYLDAYYANIMRLSDAGYRAAVVRDVAASGIYVDPTLIIYAMLPVYLDDKRFGALQDDRRVAYLPKETRESYLDPDKNPYRADLATVFKDFLARAGADTTPARHFDDNIKLLSTLMAELHDAGVSLLLGTDAFGALVPGFAVHQELELMVTAGLTPYEALQTGTVNAARYLGEADKAGTIEVGKRADFILVAGDPLKDVGNAAAVHGVFSGGKWYAAHDLQAMLEQAKEPASDVN